MLIHYNKTVDFIVPLELTPTTTKMKITLFVIAASIAVAMAAQQCHDGKECTCHHQDQVATCEDHQCICVSTGHKRETHVCTMDDECVNYDCHGHGTPSCIHHGTTEHGHNLCGCVHAKRETHVCTMDDECVNYDCHGHGTPSCIHHGSTEHGHNLCGCVHV